LAERLAQTLRNLRADAELSQVQMAKRLRISRSSLNRLEAGSQNTTLQTLDHLCRVLRFQPGDLFDGAPGTTIARARRAQTVRRPR
jgi:transcriptional regulator with XRE-family HTH domain